ncbi:MAG: 3-oxoacyl-[acyl-carrier-protein] reductase [Puniceicoccales bacterium]|jgi:3-oxoacyl-[acyl-carrier protein] reductase|nr:3-oxoacyl-[acyl-carrier-protein] reductase [Puniceicoccales bacterium]
MKKLTDKIALVTGAGRGIGKAIAEHLAQEGAHVICISRTAANCQQVTEGIRQQGNKAEAFAVDVSSKNAVYAIAKQILSQYEAIDILVNNAGITCDKLFVKMQDEDWEQVLLTNLFSAFYVCKSFVQPMVQKRWGRIINVSSVAGITGNVGQVNYSAAKAGLLGFTKSLAKELAGRNITVNAIAPGFVATDMTQSLHETIVEQAKKCIPLKRFGLPDEVAAMAVFLASDEANYITGQVMRVDGGMVM